MSATWPKVNEICCDGPKNKRRQLSAATLSAGGRGRLDDTPFDDDESDALRCPVARDGGVFTVPENVTLSGIIPPDSVI